MPCSTKSPSSGASYCPERDDARGGRPDHFRSWRFRRWATQVNGRSHRRSLQFETDRIRIACHLELAARRLRLDLCDPESRPADRLRLHIGIHIGDGGDPKAVLGIERRLCRRGVATSVSLIVSTSLRP